LRECIEACVEEHKRHVKKVRDDNVAIINKVIDTEMGKLKENQGNDGPLSKSPNSYEDVEI
jgi:hypothetical protein